MLHTFLDFELDEQRRELRCQGQPVATQSRVFDLIVHLLHARDRVVSRDELMHALWDGNVVSDAAISQIIMLARKALNDEGESQRVIKTVRGRGIRFVADVESHTPRATSVPAVAPAQLVETGPRSPLFGRADELRTLRAHLGRAELGQGSLMLIAGEPGIGKTTLAEELARDAQSRSFDVIWGRAWEMGGAPPYWPWIQVLRAIAQREGVEHMEAVLRQGAPELLSILPEFASEHASRGEALAQELDGARARFRQFDVMSRLLRHLTGRSTDGAAVKRRPLLIILDDLHAADDASVQLLRFLMPELAELGLLVLGTYRDLEVSSTSALAALADSCRDNTLRLSGLLPDDISDLLRCKLGEIPSPRFSSALHRLSAGNPLLLAELCLRLDPKADEPLHELSYLSDFAVPERIVSAVRKHLIELPEATRDALSAASALGREFSAFLLARLLTCSEGELLDMLSPAVRQGVLRHASPGRLIFSHALVCNAVYAGQSPTRRLKLHRAIGELLEQTESPARLKSYEIAHHFFLAAADGCRDKALRYAERAAQEAAGVRAYESAAQLFERAITLAELERVDSLQFYELLMGAAYSWAQTGNLERTAERFDQAAALARSLGDHERMARAVLYCASALRGSIMHNHHRQRLVREALALLPERDSDLRAGLLSVSVVGLRSPDTITERDSKSQAAVDMARRLGDPEPLLWALDARHLVMWGVAAPSDMIGVAREMVELARKVQHHDALLDGLLWTGCDACELGDVSTMWAAREEYTRIVNTYGGAWHRYMALGFDCLEATVYGHVERARQLSAQTLAVGRQVHDALADTFHAVRMLLLDFQHGTTPRVPGASHMHIEPPAFVSSDYKPFWALAWADSGYTEAARQMLKQTLERERELLDALRRPTLAVMAQVAILINERAALDSLYRLLLPSSGRQLCMQACICLGSADYYLGLLARELGNTTTAAEHLQRAMNSTFARVSSLHAQYEYGRLLAEQSQQRQEAERVLALVEESAARFNLSHLVDGSRQVRLRLA